MGTPKPSHKGQLGPLGFAPFGKMSRGHESESLAGRVPDRVTGELDGGPEVL